MLMKHTILFVDDEPHVLEGLKRMLRPMRKEWEMYFVQSGAEALELLRRHEVDVIVTDMRMPGMDGAELLTRVMSEYPRVVRIVLSGYSELEVVVRTVLPAHQYLAKPCAPENLKRVINRALTVRNLVEDDSVQALISQMHKLPALPQVYHQVVQEITRPEPSLKVIGEIIAQDVGMSAKLLKLVNSPFFGFFRHISSPEQAATLLGTNVLRALILTVHVFSVYDFSQIPGFSLAGLWQHSLATARLARKVGELEGLDKYTQDECYIGGLLHDVGKLVLASQLPEQYHLILEEVSSSDKCIHQAEAEILGTSHAEIGAYLMGLWGLSNPVVESIAFHHYPQVPDKAFRPLVAVYAANILERRHYILNPEYALPEFDYDYLEEMGLTSRLPHWEEMAQHEGRRTKDR